MSKKIYVVLVTVLSFSSLYAASTQTNSRQSAGIWRSIKNFIGCGESSSAAAAAARGDSGSESDSEATRSDFDSSATASGADSESSDSGSDSAQLVVLRRREFLVRAAHAPAAKTYTQEKVDFFCLCLERIWRMHLSVPVARDGCYLRPDTGAASPIVSAQYTARKLHADMRPLIRNGAAAQELYYLVDLFISDYMPQMLEANPDAFASLGLLQMGLYAWQAKYACDGRVPIECDVNGLFKNAYDFFSSANHAYSLALQKTCERHPSEAGAAEVVELFEELQILQRAYQSWCLELLLIECGARRKGAQQRLNLTLKVFCRPDASLTTRLEEVLGIDVYARHKQHWTNQERMYSRIMGRFRG